MKNEVDLIKNSHYIIYNKLEANGREYNLFSVKLGTFSAQQKGEVEGQKSKRLCGGLVSALS